MYVMLIIVKLAIHYIVLGLMQLKMSAWLYFEN